MVMWRRLVVQITGYDKHLPAVKNMYLFAFLHTVMNLDMSKHWKKGSNGVMLIKIYLTQNKTTTCHIFNLTPASFSCFLFWNQTFLCSFISEYAFFWITLSRMFYLFLDQVFGSSTELHDELKRWSDVLEHEAISRFSAVCTCLLVTRHQLYSYS